VAGCQLCDGVGPATSRSAGGPVPGEQYLLPAEPPGAKGVLDARKEAKDGDEVVVVGWIGGTEKPWVEGRASFQIVDTSIDPCPPEEGCPTPWDCCCVPLEDRLQAMTVVKVVEADGQTVPTDARQYLGVKELQTVVVTGRAKRDEAGNLTVLASGIHVRPDEKK
jgi:hypothetical protein